MKTKRTIQRKNKTKRITNRQKSYFVTIFLEILNTVKLYHWKTRSYAKHKATDELYGKLNENIDKFIEVLLGKEETLIKIVDKQVRLMDFESSREFKTKIYKFRDTLIEMDLYMNKKKDSDLLSIRDDILVDINQFLYLMTFE